MTKTEAQIIIDLYHCAAESIRSGKTQVPLAAVGLLSEKEQQEQEAAGVPSIEVASVLIAEALGVLVDE
jgi:hypothetical protein